MLFMYFCAAFLLSFFLTPAVRSIMIRFGIVDHPKSKRKIHKMPIALGGGIAIFASFFGMVFIARFLLGDLGSELITSHLIGLAVASLVLIIGGFIDDKYTLLARQQIWFGIAAAIILISFGVGLEVLTNPFGGFLMLTSATLTLPILGEILWLSNLIVFLWLMGMMMTTKLLDGLDGLVTGVVAIGAIVIFFLTMQPELYQPEVALLSLLFAGVLCGFLIWNWHPAKIFLGEGGSTMVGLILGTLAIISGGKIATALLVMGVPILDIIRVMTQRVRKGQSPFTGDSEHLHFKLIHSGLSQKQAVLLFYSISLLFGLTTLFLQSSQKVFALLLLLVLMLLLSLWLQKSDQSK
jgi:UDP-GlcNAc:undecaprenyl-phosphate GlcNAc-1-phosphate transferase